jgi:hypothetical protein
MIPSVLVEAMESTPHPYLPASCMPDGEMDDGGGHGHASCSGRICNWASFRVNQSLSWLKRSSPASNGG